ncbi:MAG TPA: hypothetical protein VHG51_10985 [Longimicrobiaceae bacterium]|nr:hypothetical protein [Longimicrobiaceae bacterium]
MKSSVPRRVPLLALACSLLAAGCSPGEDEAGARAAGAAEVDTTNQRALDGLSAEQMQEQARPLTPEQAEAMGMVDTTIHVESLQSPDDSVLMGGASAPPPPSTPADTARAPGRS